MRKIWYVVQAIFHVPFFYVLLTVLATTTYHVPWTPKDLIMLILMLPYLYVMIMSFLFVCHTVYVFAFYSIAFGILTLSYYLYLKRKAKTSIEIDRMKQKNQGMGSKQRKQTTKRSNEDLLLGHRRQWYKRVLPQVIKTEAK